MNNLVQQLYAPAIHAARVRFTSRTEPDLLRPNMSERALLLFLIFFSSVGVGMTEPVEGWIRRAGEQCERRGLSRLGRALRLHAQHEANHHLMMIEDTKILVARYNHTYRAGLDPVALLARGPTPATTRYAGLHEDVIESVAPFCQIAIEYEIEGLSVTLGPRLMAHCKRTLGPEVLSGLSFLEEHIEIDAGHTKFNEAELEKLLREDPARVDALVRAGSAALDAYSDFLLECLGRVETVLSGETRDANAATAG